MFKNKLIKGSIEYISDSIFTIFIVIKIYKKILKKIKLFLKI